MKDWNELLEALHSALIDEVNDRFPRQKPVLHLPLRKAGFELPSGDISGFMSCAVSLGQEGGKGVVLDVNNGDAANALIDEIVAQHGALHVLVNNAGIAGPFPATFETETVEQWQRILSINVQGVFLGCKHAVPAMRRSGGGSIVNTSSLAAFLGTPDLSAYGASKGAVRQFTKTVAIDCARKGYKVRCNSVHPGKIATPMLTSIFDQYKQREAAGGTDPRPKERRIPLGEEGTPDDVANLIAFLASDEARYITATEIVVDGGLTAFMP